MLSSVLLATLADDVLYWFLVRNRRGADTKSAAIYDVDEFEEEEEEDDDDAKVPQHANGTAHANSNGTSSKSQTASTNANKTSTKASRECDEGRPDAAEPEEQPLAKPAEPKTKQEVIGKPVNTRRAAERAARKR